VLDIGAGRGAVTAPLLDAGARVIAFELHPGRAASLRERFAGTNVVVVRADASDLRLPRRPFHVVANPPFAIATSLMRRLTSRHSQLVSAALVLPDHAAARWSRELPSRFGASTAALPSQAFRPRPPGRVAVLHIVCR
jgi:23S rRNA (adenine-N6)-dimethyltransferase